MKLSTLFPGPEDDHIYRGHAQLIFTRVTVFGNVLTVLSLVSATPLVVFRGF